GLILRSTNRHQDAEREFRLALALWPDLPLFHCQLGDVLMRLRREAEAEAAYTRALSLDINYYLANLRMGQLLKHHGYYGPARKYIERALHADPANREAREALLNLQTDREE